MAKQKETQPKPSTKKDIFLAILKKVKEAELKEFVKEYSNRNAEFVNAFLVKFVELDDSTTGKEKYTSLVNEILKMACNRNGEIVYDNIGKIEKPLTKMVEQAEAMINSSQLRTAFYMIQALIEETNNFIRELDNNDEIIESVVDKALDLVPGMCTHRTPPDMIDEIFGAIVEKISDKKYHIQAYLPKLLYVLLELADKPDREKEAHRVLDMLYSQAKEKEKKLFILVHKITLYRKHKKTELADQVIEQNIDIPEFRELAVAARIEKKQYEEAKKIAQDGIKLGGYKMYSRQGGGYMGKPYEVIWRDYLINIAQLQGDNQTLWDMAKERFYATYDIGYYKMMKSASPAGEWVDRLNVIFNELSERFNKKNTSEYHSPRIVEVLAHIMKEEQLWERLLNLLKQLRGMPEIVFEYGKFIEKLYPAQILALYEDDIISYAQNAGGRGDYRSIAGFLKSMQKVENGKPVVKRLVQVFRVKYKARKAMMEYLDKIEIE